MNDNYNKLITDIDNLSTEERQHGLKLIHKIINNILSNPNEPKYQHINKTKILKKFCNNTVWLDLLINAGFYEAQNEQDFVFDMAKIQKLKFMNNLLLSHEWNTNNDTKRDTQLVAADIISSTSTMNKMTPQAQYVCFCKKSLIKINDASRLYHGSGAMCDFCSKTSAENEIFWHCDNNAEHKNGFDVCSKCVHIFDDEDEDIDKIIEEADHEMENYLVQQLQYLTDDNGLDNINNTNNDQKMKEHLTQSFMDVFMGNNNEQILECNEFNECNSNDIKNCVHLKRLNILIQKYQRQTIAEVNENILEIIDDYLHLSQVHDNDEHFEYIAFLFGECDVDHCIMFKRRNNRNNTLELSLQCESNVFWQFMDTIHCYWVHCFDVGNRLSIEEKAKINEIKIDNDYKQQNEFNVNAKFIKLHDILNSKRRNQNSLNLRMNQRYFQLNSEQKSNDKMFNFGFKYKYGYNRERKVEDDEIAVYPKYDTLKEELIANDGPHRISSQQFNIQYKTAHYLFETKHKKSKKEWHVPPKYMSIEHLLSLRVYCNFDNLQFEFSKTYRIDDNGKQHSRFYHLGKCLKICLADFGTQIKDGTVHSFYHGINQQLIFPQYIGVNKYDSNEGVAIRCPFSTSSSFEVAANFATSNTNKNGLIVEFSGGNWKSSKYFSVDWLSMYNEREYLFVQNYSKLEIMNIIDVKNGHHYSGILNALKCIDYIVFFNEDEFRSGDKQKKIEKMMDIMELIKAIISNQLISNKKSSKYKPFSSLTNYGKNMCDSYFENKITIKLDYLFCKQQAKQCKDSFIFDLLFHTKYEWIHLDVINVLFPRIECIEIQSINLCTFILENIISKCSSTKWKQIHIEHKHTNNELSVIDSINKFTSLFQKKGIFLSGNQYKNELNIHKCNNVEFISSVIEGFGQSYYLDKLNEINPFMKQLIEKQISNNNNNNFNDNDQKLFHQFCVQTKFIFVDWKCIVLNKNAFLFKLLYDSGINEWINLDILGKLFPNLTWFHISHIKLSSEILGNILFYFSDKKHKPVGIRISNPIKDSELNIKDAISKYKTQFEQQTSFYITKCGVYANTLLIAYFTLDPTAW